MKKKSEEIFDEQIDNLNQTSSFIANINSNNLNISVKNKTNSEDISWIGTYKKYFYKSKFWIRFIF